MIVKNEMATLGRCLDSVRDIVDEIIVVDTGSGDNTKDIAQQYGARVFELPWPDSFAVARNESIRRASGDWILWLDADDHLDEPNRGKLRHLLTGLVEDNIAYAMKCVCVSGQPGAPAAVVDHVRLFRNHPAVHWEHRVHEQIQPALRRAGHHLRFTDIAIMHTGYTDAALRSKKLERNLRLLQLEIAERPDDRFTLFNLGRSYADLGRCAEAIPLLQRSLQHSNNADSITPRLYSILTRCHRRLGQFDEAWSTCQSGNDRCPDDAKLLFLKGQLCHQRCDRAGARACWTQLLAAAHRPQSLAALGRAELMADGVFASVAAGLRGPLVRYHLAILDREEERFADAENHWRIILDETPDFHPARLRLAELYLRQERWPEMETTLDALRPHKPLDASVLRARMHLARKEIAAARQLLEDVLREAPQYLMAQVFLSHVLLQSGEERAAEPLLRRIVEKAPTHADSWLNLAVLYRRQDRLREAVAAAKGGCFHCPNDVSLLLLQGTLLHEVGDALNAETCLLRVLESDGGDSTERRSRVIARQHLIAIYRSLERDREANAQLHALALEAPD
jgi:tetratricopeptide (TPR) repeat protein